MIAVFLAEGFEETEALTTVDILRRARLDVRMAGVGGLQVTGSHGITVVCDCLAQELSVDGVEMVVLPGGMPGALNLEQSADVQRHIDYAVENNLWLGAICAAPFILGHKGLLQGRTVTCFPGYEKDLKGAQVTGSPVERDGRIVTARGMGVTIDFALCLVDCLQGEQKAEDLGATLQCKA